jgi:hypothetical protein
VSRVSAHERTPHALEARGEAPIVRHEDPSWIDDVSARMEGGWSIRCCTDTERESAAFCRRSYPCAFTDEGSRLSVVSMKPPRAVPLGVGGTHPRRRCCAASAGPVKVSMIWGRSPGS